MTEVHFSEYTTYNVRRRLGILSVSAGVFAGLALSASLAFAAPALDVSKLFREVFGRSPTADELRYWEGRRSDKPVESELRGAMAFLKARGAVTTGSAAPGGALAAQVPQLFSSVFGKPPNDKEKRYWTDRVVCKDLTTEKVLIGALHFHKAAGVTLGSGTKEEFCARAASGERAAGIGRGVNAGLGFGGHQSGPLVRIGLLEAKGKGIRVTGAGKFFLRLPEGQKKIFTGPDQTATVSWGGSAYIVKAGNYKVELESPPKFGGLDGEPLILASQTTKPSGVPGPGPYNRYRGTLEVRVSDRRDSLWAINEVRTEEYVRGLAETTDAAPPEFHKALSILARTYVLYHLNAGGRQPQNGFVITNTANDQLYAGLDYEARVPDFREQTISTKGQLLTYDAKPVAALYFSQSDGRTRSGEQVWRSKRFPYLQEKDDPHGGSRLVGHGTGLSGRGAVGFARKDNWDYRKILTYYFTGVKLERGY